MLRAAVICPDENSRNQLASMLRDTGMVAVVGVFDHYLSLLELTRMVRVRGPDAVFLSSEASSQALATVHTLVAQALNIQIAMAHPDSGAFDLSPFTRAGVKDFIRIPCAQPDLNEFVSRLAFRAEIQPARRIQAGVVVSFLPCSPRAGASTVALNTAIALARARKTLLADLDFQSGVQGFMLQLNHPRSVADAAKWASTMDTSIWSGIVAHEGNLDILTAPPLHCDFHLDEEDMRSLVEFWRPLYPVVCADLPSHLGPHALEILRESSAIFLVCTPESASLYQAQRKYAYMKTLNLAQQVKVIVNRQTGHMDAESISRAVGAPVCAEFSGNYAAVQKALIEGRGVDPNSALGRQFDGFAAALMWPPPGHPKPAAKSLGSRLLGWCS